MQESIPKIESRARFVAKVSAVYLMFAAASAGFTWYLLYHNPAIGWVIGGAALILSLGVISLLWTTRVHVQRYRAQTKDFYSKLGKEILQPSRASTEDTRAVPSHVPIQAVTVSIGMYTVPQTVALTLMSIYQKPLNAPALVIMSLFSVGLIVNSWPPSISRLALALAVAIAFNGLFVAIASSGMRRAFKKLRQGKGDAAVTISSIGLEISQGAQSSSILPWLSIDRVSETRFWILFIRDGRRLVALPKSRVPQQSLGQLREIVRTAKGQLADLRGL